MTFMPVFDSAIDKVADSVWSAAASDCECAFDRSDHSLEYGTLVVIGESDAENTTPVAKDAAEDEVEIGVALAFSPSSVGVATE